MNPSRTVDELLESNEMNPFPGLRPFREDEEFLFFGRENQIDSMVNKLAETHFLAVIGGSGSGKSSLVNCGLRPALHTGLMASAGTRWKMAQFRPGNDPIGEMAKALAEDGILFSDYQADGMTLAEIVDTSLRMSRNGLVDIFQQANLEKDVNLLVVVDQFEELFRYRQLESNAQENVYGMSAEATAFVNLLLAVKEQTNDPIHVVLTMRTDFLGDCTKFSGLAEAINEGQYLVPRMTRDERRAAISGPVEVGGARISQVLLTRLVNDVGDNPDQLSILQHALNRTWARWQSEGRPDDPLDLPQYEAIGTMESALDQHAEHAYAELTTPRQRRICERIFKVLTDKATDPRGVRRPTILGALCAMAEAEEAEIIDIIDVFRKPSRSFLMPPAGKTIELDTVVDISHESLMRVWQRLNTWADAEARSARLYGRLADAARRYEEGTASLLRNPDLQVALDWREKEKPTEAWANLYQGGFDQAMAFLKKSKNSHDSEVAEAQLLGILRVARNFILGIVLVSLVFGPFGIESTRIKSKQFKVDGGLTDAVKTDQLEVAFLEQSETKENLVNRINELNKLSTSNITQIKINEELDELFNRIENDFSADEKTDLKNGLITRALIIGIPADVEKNDNGRSELWESLNVERPETLANKRILVLPKKVDVITDYRDQAWLVRLILQYQTLKDAIQSNLKYAAKIFQMSTILFHLCMYFFLVFCVGFVYRRLEFRNVATGTQTASTVEPWHVRLGALLHRVNEGLERLRTRPWRLLFYFLALTGALLLLRFALDQLWTRLVLGVLAVLLFPPNALLRPAWAARVKKAQGLLLQFLGLFALIVTLVLFVSGDYYALNPSFSLSWNPWVIWNPWVFLLIGIGLTIIGKIKYSLTTEEGLMLNPDKSPVVYFSSFDNAKQDWKEAWAASSIRFFRPKEERIIRSIFETLGPFVPIGRIGEAWPEAGLSEDESLVDRLQETEIIKRSELIILQIDERPSENFLSIIREILQTVAPDQVLVYFSLKMDPETAGASYDAFVAATEGVFPEPLPPSIIPNRFLAFDQKWATYVFGDMKLPKISFGKFLPLMGRRLDIVRARRTISRSLKHFFANRKLVDLKKRLYSDFAIGFAAFPLFALLPSGYMMFINLWRTGRRLLAGVGLFVPVITFFAVLFVYSGLDLFLEALSADWYVAEVLLLSILILIILGFPFLVHRLWTGFCGTEIRQHVAFGGSLQSWKKNLLVPLSGLSVFIFLFLTAYISTVNHQRTFDLIDAGRELAENGDIENAVKKYAAALERDREIDLIWETERLENNPRAVALMWYGVALARKGEVENAIKHFREARRLDPEIDLDPTHYLDNDARAESRDPEKVARRLASGVIVAEGREKVEKGNIEEAVETLKKAKALDEHADLNPQTKAIEKNPEAVALVWKGAQLAGAGSLDEAIKVFKEARDKDKHIDLDPVTEQTDEDPKQVANKLAAAVKIQKSRALAQTGDLDGAIASLKGVIDSLKEASALDSRTDLYPETSRPDQNPEAVARVWYGVWLAESGDWEAAAKNFRQALKLDKGILIEAQGAGTTGDTTKNVQQDPVKIAQKLASRAALKK